MRQNWLSDRDHHRNACSFPCRRAVSNNAAPKFVDKAVYDAQPETVYRMSQLFAQVSPSKRGLRVKKKPRPVILDLQSHCVSLDVSREPHASVRGDGAGV
jgi:hypothetical protein